MRAFFKRDASKHFMTETEEESAEADSQREQKRSFNIRKVH